MKIKVLGCGNAFSTVNGNNCFLLEDSIKFNVPVITDPPCDSDGMLTLRMLIDAGWDLPHMLERNGVAVKSITDVYVSHAHADHVGGLEYLGFMRYDWVNKPQHAVSSSLCPPTIIANSRLMKELWKYSLKGGMSSLEGVDATLETFFKTQPIEPNGLFRWLNWDCKLIQQIHIMTGTVITNTFGLFMEKEGHPTIYFVTDSQHCSPRQIEIFYKQADIIFQDCECIGVDTSKKDLKFCSGVHANYAQLAGYPSANSIKLPDDIKKKMWLTHYQDFVSEDKDFFGKSCDWNALANEDGFAGFVKVGQEWEV